MKMLEVKKIIKGKSKEEIKKIANKNEDLGYMEARDIEGALFDRLLVFRKNSSKIIGQIIIK